MTQIQPSLLPSHAAQVDEGDEGDETLRTVCLDSHPQYLVAPTLQGHLTAKKVKMGPSKTMAACLSDAPGMEPWRR